MKKILLIIATFSSFILNAQTPNALGGTVVNKGVEDFTGTASAQVDSFIVELVDGTLLKVPKNMDVQVGIAAPIGTAIANMWVDTVGVDTQYINNNGAWVRFTVGSTATTTLDQAYNNYGATASKVTVDAAEGQTGGLEIETGSNANVTIDLQGNSRFIVQDAGTTDLLNVDGAQAEIRLLSNLDQGNYGLTVNGSSFFAANVDFYANFRDNRANTFFSQSLNSVISNRIYTFGGPTYGFGRFTASTYQFDPAGTYTSFSAGYGWVWNGRKPSSSNDATKVIFSTGASATGSAAPGGDFFIELGVGDGGARGGRVGIGLGNTPANDLVSTPRRMLDVNGAVSIRGDLYNPNDSTGTSGQFIVKRGTGWGWRGLSLSDVPTLNGDAWSANASIANSSRVDTLTNSLAYGFFQRVGSIVNFTVKFEVALNSDTTSNVVSVSPPYASDFTDEKVDVGGTATINAGGIYGGAALKVERCILYADPTTNKISISYTVDKQGGTYPSNRVIVSASGSYIVQ